MTNFLYGGARKDERAYSKAVLLLERAGLRWTDSGRAFGHRGAAFGALRPAFPGDQRQRGEYEQPALGRRVALLRRVARLGQFRIDRSWGRARLPVTMLIKPFLRLAGS